MADTHQDKYNEQSSISLVILDESDATYILVNALVVFNLANSTFSLVLIRTSPSLCWYFKKNHSVVDRLLVGVCEM